MAVVIKDRSSKIIETRAGPGLEFRAKIEAGGLIEEYRATEKPGEKPRDHEAEMQAFGQRLERRAAVVGAYNALEQLAESQNGIGLKIVDCQIQVHGPMTYRLYVAWEEDGIRREWMSEFADEPDAFPDVAEILAMVRKSATERGTQTRAMQRRALVFEMGE